MSAELDVRALNLRIRMISGDLRALLHELRRFDGSNVEERLDSAFAVLTCAMILLDVLTGDLVPNVTDEVSE